MSAVVVRAKFNSRTLDVSEGWSVQKGDLGVIEWNPHSRHRRYLEPRVVWDLDPKHKARPIILSSIVIVGLQTATTRVLVDPVPA